MLYILISAFITSNVMHGVLLYQGRRNRKLSISHHAVENQTNYLIYIIGHIIADALFLYFSYEFFYIENQSAFLMTIVSVMLVFDFLQAIVPAKGKYENIHTLLAGLMASFMAVISLFSPFVIEVSPTFLVLYWLITLVMVSSALLLRFKKLRFYHLQMVYFVGIFLQIIILYIGSS